MRLPTFPSVTITETPTSPITAFVRQFIITALPHGENSALAKDVEGEDQLIM